MSAASSPPYRFTLRGAWIPIYLEPIPGSDERITIASAASAASANDISQIRQTITEDQAACLWGKESANLLGQIDLTLKTLRNHLDAGGELQTWTPPLEGLHTGEPGWSKGNSIDDVLDTGAAFCASLELDQQQAAKDPDKEQQEYWPQLVRQAVAQRRADLARHFDQKLRINPQARRHPRGLPWSPLGRQPQPPQSRPRTGRPDQPRQKQAMEPGHHPQRRPGTQAATTTCQQLRTTGELPARP